MVIFEAFLLGLIQGITEFVPVSSSGHLILTGQVLNLSLSSFNFDVLLNVGSFAALVYFFHSKLWDILSRVRRGNQGLLKLIIISTLPAVLFGAAFGNFLEVHTRSILLVSLNLILIGVIMLAADRLVGSGKYSAMGNKRAFGIGLAQALALVPGVSRSGATISAGKLSGLSYTQAAEYSFLIAIPVLFGAILKTLLSPDTIAGLSEIPLAYSVGVVTSAITSFLAIKFTLNFLTRHGLKYFAYYRIGLAVMLLLLLLTGVIK